MLLRFRTFTFAVQDSIIHSDVLICNLDIRNCSQCNCGTDRALRFANRVFLSSPLCPNKRPAHAPTLYPQLRSPRRRVRVTNYTVSAIWLSKGLPDCDSLCLVGSVDTDLWTRSYHDSENDDPDLYVEIRLDKSLLRRMRVIALNNPPFGSEKLALYV